MRNLLLISYFFPPHGGGGVLRPLDCVRLLEPLGWSSLVVSGPASGYWFQDPELLDRVPPGTEVHRTRAWSGPAMMKAAGRLSGRRAGRRNEAAIGHIRRMTDWLPLPDVYCGWVPFAVHAAMRVAPRASVILSSSPPESSHIVARYVARRTGLPWVADFRDPWLQGIYRSYPTRFQRSCQARMEAAVVRDADLVIANTPEAAADFTHRYPQFHANKFQTLPNGFDPAEFENLARRPRDPGMIRLVHAGGLTLGRDLSPFLAAVAELNAGRGRTRPRVRLELVGPFDPALLEKARNLGLGADLEVTGWLPRRETLARLAASDGALLLETFRPGAELVVPMKLYDYLGAGLPVLALVPEGAASRLVERTGCGTAVTSPEPVKVAAALARFVEGLESGRAGYSMETSQAVAEFERPRQVEKLSRLLERVL